MASDGSLEVSQYRTMLLIRGFEQLAMELMLNRTAVGTVHPYVGQEAIAAGVCSRLAPADRITSTHRGHGHCLAKGARADRMFAELLGRVDGYCAGKGGSMHIADFSVGMLGANGVVGAGLPIAAGAALAASVRGDGTVVVAFFGDGAVGAGAFHETLNLAALWKLPLVLVCEANGWAVRTATRDTIAPRPIAGLAAGYGIPGVVADGNDVTAMAEAAGAARDRALAGHGPTLIEAVTYRMTQHSMRQEAPPDPRDPNQRAHWASRDPIDRHRKYLTTAGWLDAESDAALQGEITRELAAALDFGLASPYPAAETAFEGVYAEVPVS